MNALKFLQSHYHSLLMIPVVAMNCTMALVETLQRYCYFDKEEEVGIVSELFLGPIRGMKMIPLDSLDVVATGLKHNKRIAVYKKHPELTRLLSGVQPGCKLSAIACQFDGDNQNQLRLSLCGHPDLLISFEKLVTGKRIFGIKFKDIANDNREYLEIGEEADRWISNILGITATMLYIPETKLSGEKNYPVYCAPDSKPVPTQPLHLTSISTLTEMNENKKGGDNVDMTRFRSNIVVKDSIPGAEGFWKIIRIGDQLEMEQTFMTPRCVRVNALDGELNPKVYDTIYKDGPFRDTRNRPCFGSYWKVLRQGVVRVGDKIMLLQSTDTNITSPDTLSEQFIFG